MNVVRLYSRIHDYYDILLRYYTLTAVVRGAEVWAVPPPPPPALTQHYQPASPTSEPVSATRTRHYDSASCGIDIPVDFALLFVSAQVSGSGGGGDRWGMSR